MMLRTPPPKRPRSQETPSDGSDRRLVIYEDPPSASPHPQPSDSDSGHMLCTYQCRQMVKSEVLDALSSAEKQVGDYSSKLEALNDNYVKAEAERKKFRDQFLHAEQELAAAKGREHALQEQLLKEVNDSEERLRKQIQSCSELEIKLQSEVNLRRKAESSTASAEEKATLIEGKLREYSESSERERKRLHNELEQLKRESKLSVSRIRADLERVECRAANAVKESELLKEQLEDLMVQLNECLDQKSEVEKKLLRFTSQEVSSTENLLVKHLQGELRNYESAVQEARKLKSSCENIDLLKEKLLEEKGRRERAESDLTKLHELQLTIDELENELSSWKLMIKDIPGLSCSDDIPVKFAALQQGVVESERKVGEANAHLKQLEVAFDVAQFAKQNAETEAARAKEKVEASKSEVRRLESMLSLVTEERDNLRNVVNEFKKPKDGEAVDGATDGALVQELESSLVKKECFIRELESNLHEQKEVFNHQQNEIQLLNEKLNNEARRIKSLERESDRLRSEISLLESKLGHGDFSSANTKVLRMVNTLAFDNEAKQTIEALRTELQKTKEKLQAVEEINSQSGDAGKVMVDSHISGKIMQLKEQIATLEKREERYKTVFADRISVFRRACCELFGYKIVMDEHQRPNGIPATRFTLQSIYAQSEDEKLQFEYESGNTSIMPNEYSSQPEISRQIEIFIRKMNSIPAFTANITVESFNRRTMT